MDNKNINNCDFESCYNICEKCEDKSYCRWLQDKNMYTSNQGCTFDANIDNIKDTTEFECIQLCQKGDGCSQNICKNICSKCSNEDTCSWVREDREYATDIQNIDFPSAPIATGIPGNNKITLKWKVNNNGGAPWKSSYL